MKYSTKSTYMLLIAVIIVWALAWPTSKIGLMDMSPMWFTASRLLTGFLTLFFILLYQKKIKLPKRQDFPLIFSIGILQMACFLILLNSGLLYVDAGRSAILVYSTPFLVTPIAVLFFQERITVAKLTGLLLGLFGLILLFSPWSFDWHDRNTVIGNTLLLLAAVCWAIAMLHTRYGTWHSPSIELVPWQLLIAFFFTLIACFLLDPKPKIHFTASLVTTALYNGIFATGFAYSAIIAVSQRLPVITTSLLLLGVPVLGLLASTWWLQEPITKTTLGSLALIVSGLAIISSKK